MDPLSALSIATSVVQFADFGRHLLSDACNVYTSVSGYSYNNVELSLISSDLVSLAGIVEEAASKTRKLRTHGAADMLEQLCEECKTVHSDMQTTLARLQAKGNSKLSLAKSSIFVALRSVASEGKLNALKERMDKIRRDITMPTLVCIWYLQ